MGFPTIAATSPSSTLPVPAAVYDHWWIVSFTLNGGDPLNVFGQVTLRKCFFAASGLPVFSPADPPVQFTVPTILQDADPLIQAAVGSLLNAVIDRATALNLL